MTTDFYSHAGYPATGASGASASMRAELDAIEAGFAKLAALTGNGSKWLRVNSGATAYEALDNASAAAALLSSVVALSGVLSPAQITANQNDYSPTGLSTAAVLRLSTDASRDVTGLAGGSAGRVLLVQNVGSFNLVLKDESGSSGAANRFALLGDITLLPDMMALLVYDSTSARWRVVGLQASAFIQTLLDDTTAAAARTTLGVEGPLHFGGRLTLTSGTPVLTSDVTAAASIYFTPHNGNSIPIYDGANSVQTTFSELTLALDSNSGHTGYHQSGKNFDLFVINDAGTIRLGTGPAWSSDTARGTGAGTTELELKNGAYTNKQTITIRFGSASGNTVSVAANCATYVGTFRATADGQTEDSLTKRFVWSNFNRVSRPMRRIDTTDSWTYTTATYRQANNSASNQLDMVRGLDEDSTTVNVRGIASNTGAAVPILVAIGLDATTRSSDCNNGQIAPGAGSNEETLASYTGLPGLGRHYLTWLELSVASGTTTWLGDAGGALEQSGMWGEVKA